jgi:predicted O-methyltransferase YrrM
VGARTESAGAGARRAGARTIRAVARRLGYDVVRVSSIASAAAGDGRHITIPLGRTTPFTAGGYDIVPRDGYDIVPRNYYSPVPDLVLLPEDVWERRSTLGGIDLQVDRAMALVETELAPFVAELEVPREGPRPPGEFFLRNQNYESVDAELLYAMIRAREPGRVLELGSGYTTLLIGAACGRNAQDGVTTEHLAYDPYPRAHIFGEAPPPPTRFEPISATDVPLDTFRTLRAGDVLFVDTTHTVKLGSDVNRIVLDVLPVLAPGVLVHFHDIFLPWEYPRAWFEQMQYYWAEQYLLQAFLAFNEAFDVLLPAQALAREHPDRLGAIVPSFSPGVSPGALWLIRR